jgi:hypothetical protein
MLKKISYWMAVSIVGTILGLTLQFAKAWTEPASTPPLDNVGAPITTGIAAGAGQTKKDSLIVGADSTKYIYSKGILTSDGIIQTPSNGYFGGNVGIGTLTPKSKLDVTGGISAGTYAGTNAAPGGGMIISGNVGIGTTSPGNKLVIDAIGSGVGGDGIQIKATNPGLRLNSNMYDSVNWGIFSSYPSDPAGSISVRSGNSQGVDAYPNTTAATRLLIESNGNLTVSGQISAANGIPVYQCIDTYASQYYWHHGCAGNTCTGQYAFNSPTCHIVGGLGTNCGDSANIGCTLVGYVPFKK